MKAFFRTFRRRLFLLSMVFSALFLGICSKSSPLYPLNDWVDVHCFFTMGRGILDGIVPYRDLYEQKGPVLYFLFALAAVISDRSFWGVFLMEVVTYGLFLYFSGRIAAIYLAEKPVVYFITAILGAVIPVSKAFAHGGGAEQLCLFMLAYSLWSVLAALHEKRPLSFWEAFFNGVFAAAVLYIKFTMLGFYMGLALFVLIWYPSEKHTGKALLAAIGQFLLGVGAVSAVVFCYFAIHGAVADFMTVYFYNNLFLYPMETQGSKLELIENCLRSTLQYNGSYSWLITAGLFLFLLQLRTHWRDLIMALLTFIGLTVGTYWGGRGYTYYGLILAVYTVFGLIALVKACTMAKLTLRNPLPAAVSLSALALTVVLLANYCLNKSSNTYLMAYEKEDHPAYRFAQTINTVEDAKILNYGFLDGGFYYAAGVDPNCKFFCTLNINAPDMWSSQRDAINNGEVDFVITRRYPLSSYSADANGYALVDEADFYFEGVDFTYYLYRKK